MGKPQRDAITVYGGHDQDITSIGRAPEFQATRTTQANWVGWDLAIRKPA